MTGTALRAIVLQHDKSINLGNLGPVLVEHGYDIHVVDATSEDLSAIDPRDGDLLIVLGGDQGAYETEQYPFLLDEMQLIRTRIDAELPILGICLGAQLMAGSLGARNYRGEKPDLGYQQLTLTDAGKASPLRHTAGVGMLVWNGDHFELPAHATLLASGSAYPNEAFALGNFGLGLQFHPEVTDEMHEAWTHDSRTLFDEEGMPLEHWHALRDEHNDGMQAVSRILFSEWLENLPR